MYKEKEKKIGFSSILWKRKWQIRVIKGISKFPVRMNCNLVGPGLGTQELPGMAVLFQASRDRESDYLCHHINWPY